MSMGIDLEMDSGHDNKLDSVSHIYSSAAISGTDDGKRNVIDTFEKNEDGMNVNADNVNVNEKGMTYYEPQTGFEFETKEAAYSFYREYARVVGFGITIKASRRSKKSGKFIDVKIACSRFGGKHESSATANSRSCHKTDCRARLHIKRRQDGKWYIYSFVKEHNHEICPDDFVYAIRGRGKLAAPVPCQKRGLQLALDEEDVQVLLDYLTLSQAETPNFYYALDFGKDKRMRNVFWIDAKSRHDYQHFSDVVFFDTTYVRNKYKIPLVPIIGVNHHFQFLLLGCALVGEDTTSNLAWLMRTWLRAVGGRNPRVVITENDKALKEATAEVFPAACHCFCLWNVLREISQKLNHKTNLFEDFKKNFIQCLDTSKTDEAFRKNFWKLADDFELRDDECVQLLYDDCRKWAPIYMRGIFLGGLNTIEQSESVSSSFDKFIRLETTFKGFIEQYKLYLQERCEEEAKAEFEMQQKQPTLKSSSTFEKQMAEVYTPSVFKKFQDEVLGIVECNIHKEGEDETTMTFQIEDIEKHQNFIVAWNADTTNICCSCHSYEYRGFLCRHAMLVLQTCGVSNIPSHYILKRWTRDAKIRENTSILPGNLNFRIQRFNDLYKIATKLGEEGCLSKETYEIAFHALEEALKQCVSVNNSVTGTLKSNESATKGLLNSIKVKDSSNIARTSKRKILKCKVTSKATTSPVIQDKSQQMGKLNSRAIILENACPSQHDMQGPELGSRSVEGYYSAPQSLQRLGRLCTSTSIPEGYYHDQQSLQTLLGNLSFVPTHVGHCAHQQSLQGLGQLGFRTALMPACVDIRDSLPDIDNSVNMPLRDMHNKHPPQ